MKQQLSHIIKKDERTFGVIISTIFIILVLIFDTYFLISSKSDEILLLSLILGFFTIGVFVLVAFVFFILLKASNVHYDRIYIYMETFSSKIIIPRNKILSISNEYSIIFVINYHDENSMINKGYFLKSGKTKAGIIDILSQI